MNYIDHLPKLFEIACSEMGISNLFNSRKRPNVDGRRFCAIVLWRRYRAGSTELFDLRLIPGRSKKYIEEFETIMKHDQMMQGQFTRINVAYRNYIETTQEFARRTEDKITYAHDAIIREK